jgi:hypothetical protein
VGPARELKCVQHHATASDVDASSTATITILLAGGQGFDPIGDISATSTPQGLLVTMEVTENGIPGPGQPATPPSSVDLLDFAVLAHTSPTTVKRVSLDVPGSHVFPCPFS